jgi:ABC-2 type transport system permease protein
MATAHATQPATHRHVRSGRAPRPLRSVAGLTARLIARGAVAIALALGGLIALEGLSFETAYPDEASRRALLMWGEDPGIRIISGPATAVDTVGGFAVWDAGLYLTLILAAWALTATTRVLRGDEDTGRADLVHAAPVGARSALVLQLAVLLAACAVIGGAVGVALALIGAEPEGSLLVGLAMFAYGGTLVALSALVAQVFGTRRVALAVSGVVLAAWILLRMAANSAERREWLSWLTPVGWTDRVEAFGGNRWAVLLVPAAAIVVLAAAAVVLRGIRDAGGALVRSRSSGTSRWWGLGGPIGFAWRMNLGVLLAWAAGLAAAGLVIGMLLPAVDEFLESDEGFLEILALFGMSAEDIVLGFVAMQSVILGLVIAVYAAFRMGATRAEEASTRAEFLLTRPMRRWRWLGAHVVTLAASVVALSAVAATAVWIGVLATDGPVTAADAFAASANALPAIAVFAGLAVFVFGLLPRLTVPVAAGAAVVAYVVELVGPVLEWPEWVLNLSPFHHLEQVPVDPVGVPAALVMTGIGLVLAIAGILAFERRDLVGA